jgi:molybdopterin/thiamine biosynthesis adenylyltransferase
MNPTIRFTAEHMNRLRAHLFGGGHGMLDERAAFAYAIEVPDMNEHLLLVQKLNLIDPKDCSYVGPGGITLRDEIKVEAIMLARRTGRRLIEIHSHPGPLSADSTSFSEVDDKGHIEFDRYLSWKYRGPWAALVFGERCVAGSLWTVHGQPSIPINRVMVEGRPIPSAGVASVIIDTERLNRQLLAFSEEGQKALGFIKLGVIGCGGLGSFIAMYAVLLGVRRFVLVDDDTVSLSNLNRLPHVFPPDVGRNKVEALAEYLRRCDPAVEVEVIHSTLRSSHALSRLRFCDVISGGVDNDGARIVLAHLAAAYLIPYLDAGSDIVKVGDAVIPGGRVHIWTPGTNCLRCDGLINDEEVREVLSTKSEREVRAHLGYAGNAPLRSPSIGHVNGHVASSLVDELHALVAGAHPVHRLREYRANRGQEVERKTAERIRYCACCTEGIALGDAVDLTRFHVNDDYAA